MPSWVMALAITTAFLIVFMTLLTWESIRVTESNTRRAEAQARVRVAELQAARKAKLDE